MPTTLDAASTTNPEAILACGVLAQSLGLLEDSSETLGVAVVGAMSSREEQEAEATRLFEAIQLAPGTLA